MEYVRKRLAPREFPAPMLKFKYRLERGKYHGNQAESNSHLSPCDWGCPAFLGLLSGGEFSQPRLLDLCNGRYKCLDSAVWKGKEPD